MKIHAIILLVFMLSPAHADPLPGFMGEWKGSFLDAPKRTWQVNNPSIFGRVVGMPGGAFQVQLMNAIERGATYDLNVLVSPENGEFHYSDGTWAFQLKGETLQGTYQGKRGNEPYEAAFEMQKITRISPTMGRKPPADAEDLFAHHKLNQWQHEAGKAATWRVLDDGVVECYSRKSGNEAGGDMVTRQHYGDCEIHLEFKLPYEPDHLSQGRANSGLFIMGYEVQILDSFGFNRDWSTCGALYKVAPSKVSRSAPPEQWQTYDVVFRAARFDPQGKVSEFPVITVRHNGGLIHHEQVIDQLTLPFEKTRNGLPPREGPLKLQDHGHPIQFRNFWVRPL